MNLTKNINLKPFKRIKPIYYKFLSLISFIGCIFFISMPYLIPSLMSSATNELKADSFIFPSYLSFTIFFFSSVYLFFKSKNTDKDGYCIENGLSEIAEEKFQVWTEYYPELLDFKNECIRVNGYITYFDYERALNYVRNKTYIEINNKYLEPLKLDISVYKN